MCQLRSCCYNTCELEYSSSNRKRERSARTANDDSALMVLYASFLDSIKKHGARASERSTRPCCGYTGSATANSANFEHPGKPPPAHIGLSEQEQRRIRAEQEKADAEVQLFLAREEA